MVPLKPELMQSMYLGLNPVKQLVNVLWGREAHGLLDLDAICPHCTIVGGAAVFTLEAF